MIRKRLFRLGDEPAQSGRFQDQTGRSFCLESCTLLNDSHSELSDEVKRKMFTFPDIPERIEKRDIAGIVRQTDQETLLKALAGATDNAPAAREFILSSISSRVAEQVRADLAEMGKVKIREAEEAQTGILKIIRQLESQGELKLIPIEE